MIGITQLDYRKRITIVVPDLCSCCYGTGIDDAADEVRLYALPIYQLSDI